MAEKARRRAGRRTAGRAKRTTHELDLDAIAAGLTGTIRTCMPGKRPPKNPRTLRPATLLQILNGTPLGTALTERQMHSLRMRAGTRIGDGRTVDLLRFAAWLVGERHRNVPAGSTAGGPAHRAGGTAVATSTAYERHRDRSRERQAANARSGMEIGELPPIADPARRAAGLASLKDFCDIYFSATFYLPWADPQLQSITDLERTILNIDMLAEAMPRGWGKSARFERAVLWAGLKGVRRFGVILGKNKDAGIEIIDAIKTELESNETLAADFPEVCIPIQRLEGVTQRANAQMYQGERTRITWKEREIILPTIPGSAASGFIIRTAGLEKGRVRGMKHARPDGTTVRPDLVLIDDPQDEEIAANPQRVEKCIRKINGAVLRMAGPDQRIAAMASVTVAVPNDLSARLIDRAQSPKWHGRRYQTVLEFPRDRKGRFDPQWWALWEQYWEIRCDEQRRDQPLKKSTAFYKLNRAAMDDGIVVAWEHKVEPGDISAIQSAMNWLMDDPESFWAEAQNDPQPVSLGEASFDADGLWAKVLRVPRGTVPADKRLATAFIDVQKPYLPWVVAAWQDGFGGHLVDFGTWPDQGEPYFKRRGAKRTMARAKPGASRTEQLYHALESLTGQLLGKAWPVEHEGKVSELSIDLCLIDSAYDTDAVVQFIREKRNPRIMPSRGDGLKPSDTPITERKAREGQQLGHHWMIHVPSKRAIRHVFIDTNRWKSIVAEGLAANLGAANAITLCHDTRGNLRVLLDQLTAEYPEANEARGRRLDLWSCRPNRENDLWDGLVGCAAAASVRGITAAGHTPPPKRRRRRSPSVEYL